MSTKYLNLNQNNLINVIMIEMFGIFRKILGLTIINLESGHYE